MRLKKLFHVFFFLGGYVIFVQDKNCMVSQYCWSLFNAPHLCLGHHYNSPLYEHFLCLCAWASGVAPSCSGDTAYRESLFQGTVAGDSLLFPFPYVVGAALAGMAEDVACVHSMPHHLHK